MSSYVSFSFFYSVTRICHYKKPFFPQLPRTALAQCVRAGFFFFFNLCLCISGSITISYRCKQWWVSVKVSGWRLKRSKTQVGGLTRGGEALPLAYSKAQHGTAGRSRNPHDCRWAWLSAFSLWTSELVLLGWSCHEANADDLRSPSGERRAPSH